MALCRGVDRDPYRRRLVASVTTMCRDLGILVVAEGIETEAEKATLVELGCDLLQGFLIGTPQPVAAEAG
jgi:EAL domain-containing protein (putative c-di-GMP-specific phosphodiesterase class I)